MFEQAVLSNGPASKRVWTTFAGVTGQALLVTFAVMIPMIWPEAMPSRQTLLRVFTPGPPPAPPPKGNASAVPVTRAVTRPFRPEGLVTPASAPAHPLTIVDEPPETAGGPGVPGGVPGGDPHGIANGVLSALLGSGAPAVAPPRPVEHPVAVAAKAPSAVPVRIRSSVLRPAKPVFRPEPAYPELARRMRVSGVVELEGIVGTDGRIREPKLLSGNPLLAPAAMEAVRRWVYEPTILNGQAVEVIAPITVTFRLN